MKLSEIARNFPVIIERDCEFQSLGTLKHSMPKMLVFIEDEKFIHTLLRNEYITCVITTKELLRILPNKYGVAISEKPRKVFYEFHNYLSNNTNFYWKDFPSEISQEAKIHPNAHVAQSNVRVGAGVYIEPGVIVLEHSIIGDNVVLRSGCTIGSQGFEFKRIGDVILPVAHAGGVMLHNRVEIQANSNVDSSVFGGFTEIGQDTKIDTFVHIGHNVRIGKRSLIAAATVISGSTTIGNDVWIGVGAKISNEINIGNRAHITIGSVVTKDVEVEQKVSGNFAIDHDKFIEFIKKIR